MKKMKILIGFFTCTLLLIFIKQTTSANYVVLSETTAPNDNVVSPAESEPSLTINLRFSQIYSTSVGLSKSGSTAIMGASIIPKSPPAELKLYVYLERNQNGTWTPYNSWSTSKTGISLVLTQNYTVARGYTYRVKASCYANGENHVTYSNSVAF